MKTIITKKNRAAFLLVLALLLMNTRTTFAQSQGPLNPSLVSEPAFACLGCPGEDWTSWANAESNDHQFAETDLMQHGYCFQSTCYFSRVMTATKYHFSIPLTATLTGIEVQMEKYGLVANAIQDTIIQLTFSGVPLGNNNPLAGLWTGNDSLYIYGGSTDLWGYA